MAEPLVTRFEALLSEERQCILAGDFGGLEPLGSRKAALFEELRQSADAGALRRIGTGLKRNQRLLSAAISGVREAERRVSLLTGAAAEFTTYDARGRQAPTGKARRALDGRA
ncbi:hypothetical protein [Pseudoroseicyclus sp. CXY001]|uniref:hypothetical protein n=1 Tax=Pseudoroseicyclus sp. CXY001 TaxID=3242492 RepID=UPI003570AA52